MPTLLFHTFLFHDFSCYVHRQPFCCCSPTPGLVLVLVLQEAVVRCLAWLLDARHMSLVTCSPEVIAGTVRPKSFDASAVRRRHLLGRSVAFSGRSRVGGRV